MGLAGQDYTTSDETPVRCSKTRLVASGADPLPPGTCLASQRGKRARIGQWPNTPPRSALG